MVVVKIPRVLCGGDENLTSWELDTAWQTSVNGLTLLAGSEVDLRPFRSFSVVLENITNDVTFRFISSNDTDFVKQELVMADYAMTAGAALCKFHIFSRVGGPGTTDVVVPGCAWWPYRYMKMEIFSTVGGTHGDARVRYTAWF